MRHKQVWNGKNWEKVELCDNANRNTEINYGQGIGVIQCYDNPAEFSVTIHYTNCIGDEFDQDSVKVCRECLKTLKKSAKKHGYRVESKKVR